MSAKPVNPKDDREAALWADARRDPAWSDQQQAALEQWLEGRPDRQDLLRRHEALIDDAAVIWATQRMSLERPASRRLVSWSRGGVADPDLPDPGCVAGRRDLSRFHRDGSGTGRLPPDQGRRRRFAGGDAARGEGGRLKHEVCWSAERRAPALLWSPTSLTAHDAEGPICGAVCVEPADSASLA